MGSEFTKVGPPDEDDRPSKKSGLFRAIWQGSLFSGLFSSMTSGPFGIFRAAAISKTMEFEQREEADEQKQAESERWHGLPEAELTEEQRQEGARRLHEEDARRRAGGE